MVEIPLTQGKIAIVDDEDLALVVRHSWSAKRVVLNARVLWYAHMDIWAGKHRYVLMHRLILALKPGDPGVDHRDGDGLNNRRGNLRLATHSQNKANSDGHPTVRKSRYKGVYWSSDARYTAGGRWRVQLTVNGKQVCCSAKSEVQAAQLYNELALRHFGRYSRLNDLPAGQT